MLSASLNQKQPFTGFLWKSCSDELDTIYRKTPIRGLFFNKILRLQPKEKILHRCFPVSFAKHFKHFCKTQTPLNDCFFQIRFFVHYVDLSHKKCFLLTISGANTVNLLRAALPGSPWQSAVTMLIYCQ